MVLLVRWTLGILRGFYGCYWEWLFKLSIFKKNQPIQIWGPVIFRHSKCFTVMSMKYGKLFVEVCWSYHWPFLRSTVAIASCRTWSIFGNKSFKKKHVNKNKATRSFMSIWRYHVLLKSSTPLDVQTLHGYRFTPGNLTENGPLFS